MGLKCLGCGHTLPKPNDDPHPDWVCLWCGEPVCVWCYHEHHGHRTSDQLSGSGDQSGSDDADRDDG